MRLSDIHELMTSLDAAYASIAAARNTAGPAGELPGWEAIVRGAATRAAGLAMSNLRYEGRETQPGIPYNPLSDQLAAEVSQWVRLAASQPSVRSLLGIERVDPEPGARLGAMVLVDQAGQLSAAFSASGRTLTPSTGDIEGARSAGLPFFQSGGDLPDLRSAAARATPHVLSLGAEAGAPRWSFTDVRDGYAQYLAHRGAPDKEAALSRLHTCATPRLLGGVTSRPGSKDTRVPLAISEAWLFDGPEGQRSGALAPACEACQFAQGVWGAGIEDRAASVHPGGTAALRAEADDWARRIRERPAPTVTPPLSSRPPPQDGRPPAQDTTPPAQDTTPPAQDATPPAQDAAPPAQGAADSAPPSRTLHTFSPKIRRGALTSPAAGFVATESLIDLPERDVTGVEQRLHRRTIRESQSSEQAGAELFR
ncbi:MAG: hypothetical protein R3B70_38670, partial [Polyangiaceae bacterium]